MPHIEPLDRAAITDPELLALMARAEALGVPDDLFTRILARFGARHQGEQFGIGDGCAIERFDMRHYAACI